VFYRAFSIVLTVAVLAYLLWFLGSIVAKGLICGPIAVPPENAPRLCKALFGR